MLFLLTCCDLCLAASGEIIYVQCWKLLVALHFPHTCIKNGIFCKYFTVNSYGRCSIVMKVEIGKQLRIPTLF
jgi:hypothetical protein